MGLRKIDLLKHQPSSSQRNIFFLFFVAKKRIVLELLCIYKPATYNKHHKLAEENNIVNMTSEALENSLFIFFHK